MGLLWTALARLVSRPPRPRLALVVCVRNEAAFLPAHLLYHHAIGVERAYVFLDRCSDDSAAFASSFGWARAIPIDPTEAAGFSYVSDLHTACMNRALELARAEGFEWLLTLDPDEYAFANNPVTPGCNDVTPRAHLGHMLARARRDTMMIRLPTRELVPAQLPVRTPFWKQQFFQTAPRLVWQFLDPVTGRIEHSHSFLGHRQGKSIVRTSGNVQAYDSHRWVPYQGMYFPDRPEYVDLPTEELGWHWHFYVTSQKRWLEKFRKLAHEPDVWFCGTPVETPKQCWKNAASCLGDTELEGYFDRWIARPKRELSALAQEGLVERTDGVENVLWEAGLIENDMLRLPSAQAKSDSLFCPASYCRQLAEPQGSGPRLRYPLSQSRKLLRGFHALERCGNVLFRWSEPSAALRLQLMPQDYRLFLCTEGAVSRWRGDVQVSLNDRPIPCRQPAWKGGRWSQVILRSDFPHADEYWLQLKFPPQDKTDWPVPDPRPLGAPVVEVQFEPLS